MTRRHVWAEGEGDGPWAKLGVGRMVKELEKAEQRATHGRSPTEFATLLRHNVAARSNVDNVSLR